MKEMKIIYFFVFCFLLACVPAIRQDMSIARQPKTFHYCTEKMTLNFQVFMQGLVNAFKEKGNYKPGL